jgi:hypothetical protein
MSHYINNSFGSKPHGPNKGKFYWSLDFEVSENLSENSMQWGNNPTVGKLMIGNSSFDFTYSEVNKLFDTLKDLKVTLEQKRKLGIYK